MTPDGIVTLLALIVAAYQIMPRARRLDIRLRFGPTGWIIVTVTTARVLYFQLFPVFSSAGFAPNLGVARRGLDPQRATFVLLLLAASFFFAYLRVARLSIRRINQFRELTEELLATRQYPQLITLLSLHLLRLDAFAKGKVWSILLRRRVFSEGSAASGAELESLFDTIAETTESLKTRITIRHRLRGFVLLGARGVVRCLPDRSNQADDAQLVLSLLLGNREFAAGVIASRPYFALTILSLEREEIHDFFENYMRLLFSDSSSVLYREIRSCQNISPGGGYVVPPECQLMHYLFADARRAEHLEAWRPIGEAMIVEMDRLFGNPAQDPYNFPVDAEFERQGCWELSLSAGLHYFDVMVTSALHQGITWHMWLFYFPHFAGRIVRNYTPRMSLVDLSSEWPGRYAYLAYQLVAMLKRWILAVLRMPRDQENVRLEDVSLQHENGNIPKSSILALADCLSILLNATEMPERFRRSLAATVFDAYLRLRAGQGEDYASVLLTSIRVGGPRSRPSSLYSECLYAAWQEFDKIPHRSEYLQDLETNLFA